MAENPLIETPLIKKLGIKPGQRMLIIDAPEGYVQSLGESPDGAEVTTNPDGQFDFLQVFAEQVRR